MDDLDDRESARIRALLRYEILDTPSEESFDRYTRLVAGILKMPIALISLVDSDRQWFKSRLGIGLRETPRSVSFCAHAIQSPELLVVRDAQIDPRFAENPFVLGDPHVRFYAGAPLSTPDGYRLGTLCVIDMQPRTLSASDRTLLVDVAALVSDQLELHRLGRQSARDLEALQSFQSEIELQKKQLTGQAAELVKLAEDNYIARRTAESALQEKSLYIAAMAHELRTPLNAIMGFSDVMKQRLFGPLGNERYEDYAVQIHDSGRHLLDLINDLLDLSKIEAGKFSVQPEPTAINAAIASVVRSVGGLAKEKGQRLVLVSEESAGTVAEGTDAEGPVVMADPRALKQVMLNLLSNAIKFTPAGGRIEVRVGLNREPGPVRACTVVVQDSGIGISAEDMKRVMQPYEQARMTAQPQLGGGTASDGWSEKPQGTGLGLAITDQLLRLHGSRLALESKPGEGTRASFTLKLADAAAAPQPAIAR